jgi:hypothetical protein
MSRSFVRGRVFPVVTALYVAAIGLQIFFAGLYVFVGSANIELHKTFAHVFILLSVLMFAAAFIGQVDGRAKRLTFGLFGLLVIQGMLVHVGQWFGLWTVSALHPVNAMVMAYVSVTLARHAFTMWSARTDVAAAPATGSFQPAS